MPAINSHQHNCILHTYMLGIRTGYLEALNLCAELLEFDTSPLMLATPSLLLIIRLCLYQDFDTLVGRSD